MIREIELLAPAKNAETGIEAIRHGADAVYIGADRFGARANAGNSVEDIKRLTEFAHLYNARVYVTLNTVLTDDQMPEAEKLIHELYEIGVDALIVQDMGVLGLNLPPIELHASTQADTRDVEKAVFLEKTGFRQIVLARELPLSKIKEIYSSVNVPLEIFVHGALCVCYSGQCYISEAFTGRSANRGSCAQFCRLPYNLTDADGKELVKGKHLLSLKDLNQSDNLESLIDAGAGSLKIEGRLKDITYVKNIVAYYRKKLDAIFSRRPDLKAKSSGRSTFSFEPNPAKSFNRGFTNYYLHGRSKEHVISPDTPKSIGEYVGTVKEIKRNSFTVAGLVALNNGDGLCFKNSRGEFEGFRVNRIEDNRVFPLDMPDLQPKMALYRNFDHEFEKLLAKDTAERKLMVDFDLSECEEGFRLSTKDEDGFTSEYIIESTREEARSPQVDNFNRQLRKLGNTIFEAGEVNVNLSKDFFIPASVLTEARRVAVERLEKNRLDGYKRPKSEIKPTVHDFYKKELTYLGNVTNSKAREFYMMHGVEKVADGFEINKEQEIVLMFTKHCVKYHLGWCKVHQNPVNTPAEPLFLEYKDQKMQLQFDCKNCEMKIVPVR